MAGLQRDQDGVSTNIFCHAFQLIFDYECTGIVCDLAQFVLIIADRPHWTEDMHCNGYASFWLHCFTAFDLGVNEPSHAQSI